MALTKSVLYYGKDEPLPKRIPLRAGPLSLVYENGDIRTIKLGGYEILRRVYVAIRDHNWGTVSPTLSNVEMDIARDAFTITYNVENVEGDIDFFWRGTITGGADGTVRIEMDGIARSSFQRNRVGFCVLHPSDCAGTAARIEHVDGQVEESAFPNFIAPQRIIDGTVKPVAPFEEMRAVSYEVAPGVWADVRFEGDIFEMEDQRNWTDASFKTYCTPLRLPFPVEVKEGTRVRQSVTVTVAGNVPESAKKTNDQRLRIEVSAGAGKALPQIGLGVTSHGQPLSEMELARLAVLNLAHLRVGLRLAEPRYEATLRQAATEAGAIGAQLEIALFVSDDADAELAGFVRLLAGIRPPVGRWLIFHEHEATTSERWIRLARARLAAYDPTIPIGSGTNVFFTELNRNRPPIADLDLVCYSLNPQVHAFDNLSLAETLAAQAATVASARQFIGDTPLAVTPVTLKMRFNPNATGPEPEPEPDQLPPQVDVRQMSLFGAGWTVGSLNQLAGSDVQSLTYFETSGWRGVIETKAGSPLPNKFQSLPGSVFPMYHVFADVGEFSGGEVLPTRSSNSLLVEALALRQTGRQRLLLANLSHESQQISVSGLPERVAVRLLDETNAEAAMLEPEIFRARPPDFFNTSDGVLELHLLPFALARIDG